LIEEKATWWFYIAELLAASRTGTNHQVCSAALKLTCLGDLPCKKKK